MLNLFPARTNNPLRINAPAFPAVSAAILGVIVLACMTSGLWTGENPAYMHLDSVSAPPGAPFLFGTDTLGRDLFKMIWCGGRESLLIGALSTAISSVIAILYGTISGLSGKIVDELLMRGTELILSIPSILYVISILAILGNPTPVSIAAVIGATSWMNIAKIVRSEVRQIRKSEYILSVRLMGGSFLYTLRKHLLPNFIPAILFMIVSNISAAIASEATLSFMGIGLPPAVVSWGTLMSLSEKALLTNSWWIIVIPGAFLVTTMVCITTLGEYLRSRNNMRYGNL
ncbi:MAG: ABC transporter permease [Clostridiales Family XIII bacterium]|jgi:peptide/nickel transport system permease protein|nr:ABC transporter permease [Clostridiales Family XIII bacterium]